MEKRTTDKKQSVADEEITKVLDESIGGHGFWLINHRDIIETIIANRIEIAGISQTIQDLGYNRFRSEDNSYSDLELDMYEAIAKYNGDIDKEGRMTKKTEIYKAINRRIRDQKIKESEKSKIPGQKNEWENNLNQFKNYKEAMEAAYPDVAGADGFLEPDEEGLDVLRYVDENKLSQIFTESNTLDEFKTNTKQAFKEEEIKSQKEWQEQQDQYWQEQFEEQEKTDEIYAKYAVDGDIWNIKPEWFSNSKNKEIVSDLITKTLEERTPEQIAAWNTQGGAPALLDAYWAGLDDKQRGELIQYVRYYNEANYNTDVFFDHDTGTIDALERHNIEFIEEKKFEALGLTDEVKREYQTLWTMLNDKSIDQPYRLANISELELELHFNKLKNQFNNEREEVMEQKQQITSGEHVNHPSVSETQEEVVTQTSSKETDFAQYEKIILEQQASLNQLQSQFTELTKQNALMLEKLNQPLTENINDKNISKMSSSTRELTFDQIPRLIQRTKEKLSEAKIQLKNTIKLKAQKGLSVTLETLKVNEFLRSIENSLEKLSKKVQNLDTQLQVLSGKKVDQKDILLLPAPLQEAAEEIVKKSNIKIDEPRPKNKFEERLQKAQRDKRAVEENMKLQPQSPEVVSKGRTM